MKRNFFKLNSNSDAHFFLEGDKYFDFYIGIIQSAQKSIHLQTYIFDMDVFGKRVHAALIAAAARGVRIYVLVDSVGSHHFTAANANELIAHNILFYRFNGLNFKTLYQWGRRLHHKILLVDDKIAIIGGINVTTSGYGHRQAATQLDFAVVLEGEIIHELSNYCQFVFTKAYSKPLAHVINEDKPLPLVKNPGVATTGAKEDISIKISINDWVHRRHQISRAYTERTQNAQKEITIINSYFFPRKKFMKELVQAVQRGVRVRLILPGMSDWPSSILASQYLYSYFLKNGVEIYEWKKSVLHGKIATVDGSYTTIGSFNLNYTGYQQNLEMNVDIFSEKFTVEVDQIINEIINVGCEKIDEQAFAKKTTLRTRFLRFAFYLMLSVVTGFAVTLTFQEQTPPESKYLSILRILGAVVFFLLGVLGALLPVIPGIPFFVISFFLVYRQILFNRKIKV